MTINGHLKHCIRALSTEQFKLIGGQAQIIRKVQPQEIRCGRVMMCIAESQTVLKSAGTTFTSWLGGMRISWY